MKLYRTITAISVSALLLISLVGDPVCMLLVLKKARSVCKDDYGGRLKIGSYNYDKQKNRYTFYVYDQNRLYSDITYDPVNNVFTDGYYRDYISYAKNAMLGKYYKLLNECGAPPDEISVYANYQRGIIGESPRETPYKMVLIYNGLSLKEFAALSYKAIQAVRYDGLVSLEIFGGGYYLFITDIAFFADEKGILSRVKSK